MEIGCSEPGIDKRSESDQTAQAEAPEKIRRDDDVCYWWAELRKTLELFDSEGKSKDRASRTAALEAILERMRELGGERLTPERRSFAAGLEGSWADDPSAEEIDQELINRYPGEGAQALACGWQLEKQATNHKDYGARKRWMQEAAFSFASAASLLPEQSEAIRK